MERIAAKVLVVGGGPGGYVAAIRAGQLGLDTVLIEKDRIGGACLNHGCIPSKALIHAADEFRAMVATAAAPRCGISLPAPPQLDFGATIRWKDGVVDKLRDGVAALLRRAKVRVIQGRARFSDAKTCQVMTKAGDDAQVSAEHVILATGSVPVVLPSLPFGGAVISSTEALSLPRLPRRLVVVGAGYIGLELGIAFRKLGVEVAIVEQQQRILPQYDEKLSEPVLRWLKRNGVALYLGARVAGRDDAGTGIAVESDGKSMVLSADNVLVTVGRRPAVEGSGLEEMAVDMDGRFVRVDERCATSMRNVWAIGDLVGEPMLAHKASAQGEMVAEIIAGVRRRFDPIAVPATCFTEPEIVSVGLGLGLGLVAAEGRGATVSTFPFLANGRALTMGAGGEGGFVRIVADKNDNRILGIQAVGPNVSELAGEFAHALEMGAVLEDVAGTIHAHPTLGEAFHEAALRGLGHAIHI